MVLKTPEKFIIQVKNTKIRKSKTTQSDKVYPFYNVKIGCQGKLFVRLKNLLLPLRQEYVCAFIGKNDHKTQTRLIYILKKMKNNFQMYQL
jgi:hypothetical protein